MRILIAACLLSLLPLSALAQSPHERFDSLAPGDWLSYETELQPGQRAPCCFDWKRSKVRDAVCRLDREDWNFGHRDSDPQPPGARLRVLLRRDAQGADRVRVMGTHCAVEPGQARVVEAAPLAPADSIVLLQRALGTPAKRERHQLTAAIAHHAGSAADVALEHAAAAGKPRDGRRDAVFWLAQARGEHGFRVVRDLLEREQDDELRRHEVFALSISRVPAAVRELRALARRHGEAEVRGEALFWLAQNQDPQTEALVAEVLRGEPSRHITEKAVFALSQLPSKRAIPALRDLVEHGTPREVRKQALFWLAQVDDEAVLPVFDQLLGGAAGKP